MQQTFQRFNDIVLVRKPFFVTIMDVFGLFFLRGNVFIDLSHHSIPFFFCQSVLAGIVYIKHQSLHLVKLALPSGIDAFLNRQQCIGTGLAERILGNLFDIRGKILLTYFCNLLCRNIQSCSTVIVELDELATKEVILHLVANSIDCCHSIVAVGTIRNHFDSHTFQRVLKSLGSIIVIIPKEFIQFRKRNSILL